MRSRIRISALMAMLFVSTACAGDPRSEAPVMSSTDDMTASASISGDSAAELDVALVRVMNAAPGARELYVRTDDRATLPTVAFQQVSEYSRMKDNWAEFEFATTPTGVWDAFDHESELLVSGLRYTVMVLPGENGIGLDTHVLRDETPMDASKAIVRLVHAAAGADDVDLFVGPSAEALFDDMDRGDESGYQAMEPMVADVELRHDDGRVLARVAGMSFAAGTAYTLVATNTGTGGVELFWVKDALEY